MTVVVGETVVAVVETVDKAEAALAALVVKLLLSAGIKYGKQQSSPQQLPYLLLLFLLCVDVIIQTDSLAMG